jgi:hypothetical protein
MPKIVTRISDLLHTVNGQHNKVMYLFCFIYINLFFSKKIQNVVMIFLSYLYIVSIFYMHYATHFKIYFST